MHKIHLEKRKNATHNLSKKNTKKDKKTQTERTTRKQHNYHIKTRERQRILSSKRAKVTKEHNQNQSKKKRNETEALFVLAKTIEVQKKRRENGKHQGKIFNNNKQTKNTPHKSERTPKTPKKYNEANLVSPKHVANVAKNSQPFQI